jgi:hypothetical protein
MIMGIVNRQPRLGGGLRGRPHSISHPAARRERQTSALLRFCDSLTNLLYAGRRPFYPIY